MTTRVSVSSPPGLRAVTTKDITDVTADGVLLCTNLRYSTNPVVYSTGLPITPNEPSFSGNDVISSWHINPMQLDTRRRDCGAKAKDVHNCTRFEPAFEARQARYGRAAPKGSPYSGILECPCNSRFGGDPIFYPDAKTKLVTHNYGVLPSGSCKASRRFLQPSVCGCSDGSSCRDCAL